MLQLRITIARWSHQLSIETAVCNLTLFGHMTAEGLSELPVMTVSANPGVYAGLSERQCLERIAQQTLHNVMLKLWTHSNAFSIAALSPAAPSASCGRQNYSPATLE
jgi:hypothetical protein